MLTILVPSLNISKLLAQFFGGLIAIGVVCYLHGKQPILYLPDDQRNSWPPVQIFYFI